VPKGRVVVHEHFRNPVHRGSRYAIYRPFFEITYDLDLGDQESVARDDIIAR